jgi:aspartate/methionine/tyrosine aminotransferase
MEINLSASDVDGLRVSEILATADADLSERWQALTLGEGDTMGSALLRLEIKRLYENASETQIVVTCSGDAPAELAMRAVLQPGDHAVCIWPAAGRYQQTARQLGAETTLLPLRPMGHRWKNSKHWMIDINELRSAIRHNTRVLVTDFPQNPTGALPSIEEWREIASVVTDAGLRWISDESARYLEFQPEERLPAAADLSSSAVSIGSAGRAFGMPGAQVAWLFTRDRRTRMHLTQLKRSSNASAPTELLTAMVLRRKSHVLARHSGTIRSNLALATRFFEQYDDVFDWTPPSAGSTGFVKLRSDDAESFSHAARKAAGVWLMPAGTIDYPYSYLRIGLGRSTLAAGLARLEPFLNARRIDASAAQQAPTV